MKCEHCQNEAAQLNKVKYESDSGIGSMWICWRCEEKNVIGITDTFYLLQVYDTDEDEGRIVTEAKIFRSEENAKKYLASWCRDSWTEQGHNEDPLYGEEMPAEANDDEVIDRYFEFWTPEMDYSIEPMEVERLPALEV